MSKPNRLLVKLLPTVALAAADPRVNLRPLFESSPQTTAFGLGAEPAWFMADMPDGAETPWDLAHSQVAGQLGIEESAILFAEPDLAQSFVDTNEKNPGGAPFAANEGCGPIPPQDANGGKIKGPDRNLIAGIVGRSFEVSKQQRYVRWAIKSVCLVQCMRTDL